MSSSVRGLAEEDRETAYLNAAGWVIAYYLRMDVSAPDCDQFFNYRPPDEDGRVWHGQVNRVILVGETLFALRSTPAFPEMCRRMRERELRPHFLEMLEAKTFFKAGYQIHAAPETGVKGEDFDFVAVREDGQTVNAEVTALRAPVFSENTVLNALNQKRKQVPKAAAAVILCIIPEAWLTLENWNVKLPNLARVFLRKTQRINVVAFVAEHRADLGGTAGALMLIRQAFQNARPRMPMDADFLLSGEESATAAFEGVRTGTGLDVLIERSYDAEFFHWVDYLRRQG